MPSSHATPEILVLDPIHNTTLENLEFHELRQGRKLQILIDLIREAKQLCSQEYARLRQEQPESTRELLNQQESLLALNTLRKNLQQERAKTANEFERSAEARMAMFDE